MSMTVIFSGMAAAFVVEARVFNCLLDCRLQVTLAGTMITAHTEYPGYVGDLNVVRVLGLGQALDGVQQFGSARAQQCHA